MLIISFFCGASFGSFLCLIEERIYNNESIISPRSHCNYCNHLLGFIDLVPSVSYLLSRRRCRYCHKLYNSNSFQVETFLGLAFLQLNLSFSWEVMLMDFILAYCYLTDLRDQKILTILPLVLIIIILPFRLTFFVESMFLIFLFGLINYFNKGMGVGDLLLMFPLSLILGLKNVCMLIMISCSLILGVYIFFKQRKKIPFVPYLAWGFLLTNFLNYFTLACEKRPL